MGVNASSSSDSSGSNCLPNMSTTTTSNQAPGGGETVQSGPHSKLPEDPTPFLGAKLDYLIVNIDDRGNAADYPSKDSSTVKPTDVYSCYSTLAKPYQDGFTLTKFLIIPGLDSSTRHCQGIFTREIISSSSKEELKLEIVKSYIKSQEFFSVTDWSTHGNSSQMPGVQIMTKIEEMSKNGARLLCIEPTDRHLDHSHSISNREHEEVGVNLFFHRPERSSRSSMYMYRSVKVPITYSMMQLQDGLSMYEVVYQCHTDLPEQLTKGLEQGWKLVDIYIDTSSLTKGDAFASGHMTLSSMWFFEKKASDVEDSTARWEGTIVSYHHQVKGSKHDKKISKHTWDPILVEMGQRGWELACILETPETHQTGSNSRVTTLLLFFQRPIIPHASQATR